MGCPTISGNTKNLVGIYLQSIVLLTFFCQINVLEGIEGLVHLEGWGRGNYIVKRKPITKTLLKTIRDLNWSLLKFSRERSMSRCVFVHNFLLVLSVCNKPFRDKKNDFDIIKVTIRFNASMNRCIFLFIWAILLIFSPFSVVRPTQIFGILKKKKRRRISNDVVKPFFTWNNSFNVKKEHSNR